jgi:hypothetical protein
MVPLTSLAAVCTMISDLVLLVRVWLLFQRKFSRQVFNLNKTQYKISVRSEAHSYLGPIHFLRFSL